MEKNKEQNMCCMVIHLMWEFPRISTLLVGKQLTFEPWTQ